jgi:hypothetical protein
MVYDSSAKCFVFLSRIGLVEYHIFCFLLETDTSETVLRTIRDRTVEEISRIENIGKSKRTILTIDPTSTDFVHPGNSITKRRDIHTVFGLDEEIRVGTVL